MLSQYKSNCYFTAFVNLLGLTNKNWSCPFFPEIANIINMINIDYVTLYIDKLSKAIYDTIKQNDEPNFINFVKKIFVDELGLYNNSVVFEDKKNYTKKELKEKCKELNILCEQYKNEDNYKKFILAKLDYVKYLLDFETPKIEIFNKLFKPKIEKFNKLIFKEEVEFYITSNLPNNTGLENPSPIEMMSCFDPFDTNLIVSLKTKSNQAKFTLIGFTISTGAHHFIIYRSGNNFIIKDPNFGLKQMTNDEINFYLNKIRNFDYTIEFYLYKKL